MWLFALWQHLVITWINFDLNNVSYTIKNPLQLITNDSLIIFIPEKMYLKMFCLQYMPFCKSPYIFLFTNCLSQMKRTK